MSTWTSGDAEELARLEAEFAALGGRGVELAERVDALRNRRGTEFTIDGHVLVVRESERARGREVEYDVFEQLDDGEELVTVADPMAEFPTEAVLASLLTPRKLELAHIMREFSIIAGPDYDYDDVYEDLYSADPAPRYVAIRHDETYNFFDLTDDFDVACEQLAGSLGEDTGGSIHGVWDLDEGRLIHVDHEAFAWSYTPPPQGMQPWGPEWELRRARLAQAAVARLLERRVLAVLAARIKGAFPDATTLHATGEHNEKVDSRRGTEDVYRAHLYYQRLIGDEDNMPSEASLSALLADLERLAEEYGIEFDHALTRARERIGDTQGASDG